MEKYFVEEIRDFSSLHLNKSAITKWMETKTPNKIRHKNERNESLLNAVHRLTKTVCANIS